jgi:hypothetical protein
MADISTYIQWIVTSCGGPHYSALPSGDYYKEIGFEYENWFATFIRNNLSRIKNFDWDKVISIAPDRWVCYYDPDAYKADYDRYISTYGQDVGKVLFAIKYSVTCYPWSPDVIIPKTDCNPMRNLVIVALKDGRVFTVKPQRPEDVRKAIKLLKYDAVAYIEASDDTAGPSGSTPVPSFDSLIQTLETEYWKQKIEEWYAQWNAPQQGTTSSQPSQQATETAQGSKTWIWVALGLGALALFLASQKD